MPFAVLGLGSNLGSRRALLACARDLLAGQPGVSILASSPLYHTPPLGPPQPDYLNAALKVSWPGSARALLSVTQHVEQLLLRQRDQRWGPRTLDIDLLYWSAGEIAEPGLTIPHPGLSQRLFALVPLLDVAPELSARFGGALAPAARSFAPSEALEARVSCVSHAREAGSAELDDEVRTAPSEDPIEVLAALPSALASFAPAVSEARAVLPFLVPIEDQPLTLAALEAPLYALRARVDAAFACGFQVRAAAITEVGQGRFRGVFVGQHDPASSPLPSLRHVLTVGPRGLAISIKRT